MWAIGFDIGATNSRSGLVDQFGRLSEFAKTPTPKTPANLLVWFEECTARFAVDAPIHSPVGVALPGVVEPTSGTCVRCVNLPWLEGQPVADLLERKIGRRPLVMTDAQAATWAEYVTAGRPREPLAHLRLGTGVACCVVVDGRIIPTDPARRTHWPMLVADPSPTAPPCPCGLRGCLELFAGGKALTARARELGFGDLSDLASKLGSGAAASLIDRASVWTARTIVNLNIALGVQTVLLGGGVAESIPCLVEHVQRACAPENVCVRKAVLGDDAGVIGAALAAISSRLSGDSH